MKVEERIDGIMPSDEINWKLVDHIVAAYKRRKPDEYEACLLYVKKLRENLKTKYGELGVSSSMRHLCEIPPLLERALRHKFPKTMEKEGLQEFLKRYPVFMVAENL